MARGNFNRHLQEGIMRQYEYEITKHAKEDFTHLVYFCNAEGECGIDQVPENQINMLTDMFNRRGAEGWEIVQTLFGRDGIVIFWKREIVQ